MTTACEHEHLFQYSTQYVRSIWNREPDGSYDWSGAIDKVLSEETDHFECLDCGAHMYLDDDQRIVELADPEDLDED